MRLPEFVKNKRVLDIGTNSGFLALQIAPLCKYIDGFDINPYLIDIAQAVQKYLGIENANFFAAPFEECMKGEPYDVILSFANHSTFDKNTKQSVDEYFNKCQSFLKPGGTFLFESHLPSYETKEQVQAVLKCMKKYFNVKYTTILTKGNFADRGRTFAVCKRQ